MQKASIDQERISRLAELLKSANLPKPTELTMQSSLTGPELLNAYFGLIVPICHQTSPMEGKMLEGDLDGKHLVGWDYLTQRLFQEVKQSPHVTLPYILKHIEGEDLRETFSESSWHNHNFDERARLLRGLAKWMEKQGFNDATEFFDNCKGLLRDKHNTGVIGRAKETEVYSDPAEKKIRFATSLIQEGGLYKFKDFDTLGPIVDYHEVRLHLRLGTVVINDKGLEKALREMKPVESNNDVEIRLNVGKAIEELSRKTGYSVNQLHWYLWNAARNSCKRKTPLCDDDKGQESRPEEYKEISLFGARVVGTGCEFKHLCSSYKSFESNPLNDTNVPNGHFH